jgi:hypothetical protein
MGGPQCVHRKSAQERAMDIPQLKLLAGHVRNLLKQADHSVSYNQSLDLIAALPGLRNWPEVQAFPDRIAACELDAVAAGRLAYRLKRKFEMEVTSQDVLSLLSSQQPTKSIFLPQIWPTGPAAGVYVTTLQAAIDALVERYAEASDGAVLYAERAASGAACAIDLGDSGLWSSGLDRVPSGTLIIVGPIELTQEGWEDSKSRLQIACHFAGLCGHRVAVLAKTPTPNDLCEDIRLMATTDVPEDTGYEFELRGVVTEAGELVQRAPFAGLWPQIRSVPSDATPEAIPASARHLLEQVLQRRKSGFLVFGGDSVREHWAADLVAAGLALTEHAGPAARIMPRTRSTPAKDSWVPEATRQLPFLPSIQSAYDRGYRRMVIDPNQIDGQELKKLARDVLFIGGTDGYEASHILFSGIRTFGSAEDERDILTQIIGLLGVARLPLRTGVLPICDLFIGPQKFSKEMRVRDINEYVIENRALKWEDEVQLLITSGDMSIADLKEMDIKPPMLARFVEQIGQRLTATSITH